MSNITDKFLVEAGFVKFAIKLREHAAKTLEGIEKQADKRNSIVSAMLARK